MRPMGRKSSAKGHTSVPPAPPEAPRSNTTLIVSGVVAAAVAIGGLAYWRQLSSADAATADASTAAAEVHYPQPITAPPANGKRRNCSFRRIRRRDRRKSCARPTSSPRNIPKC